MSFLQCLGLFFVIMLPALDLHLTFFGFRFLLGVYASCHVVQRVDFFCYKNKPGFQKSWYKYELTYT